MILAMFLPATLGGYAAVVGAVAAVAAVLVGAWNRRKIQEVHVLVNSNLADIKERLKAVTAERDSLKPGGP